MRFIDLQDGLWNPDYTPTLFDEIIVRHGDAYFSIAGVTVLVRGDEAGPGVIMLDTGGAVPVAPEVAATVGQRLYAASRAADAPE